MKPRGKHYTNLTTVAVGLSPEHLEELDYVRGHYCLGPRAAVLRMLVLKEARKLRRIEEHRKERLA